MSKRWKSVTDRLALHKVTTDLQFVKQTKTRPEHVKHNKMKSNKMKGACTVIINLSSFSSYKLLLLFSHYVQQFCDRIDCSPPGSSVHGIFQVRILEWVAIPFSRGSFQPKDQTEVSCIAGRFLPSEPPGKPRYNTQI